jgi:hypothetical protein
MSGTVTNKSGKFLDQDNVWMMAVCTSETSANFYETTRHNIPGDSLYTRRRDNLKSHMSKEGLLFHFKVAYYPNFCFQGRRKTAKNLSHVNQTAYRDMKPGPRWYKSGAFLIHGPESQPRGQSIGESRLSTIQFRVDVLAPGMIIKMDLHTYFFVWSAGCKEIAALVCQVFVSTEHNLYRYKPSAELSLYSFATKYFQQLMQFCFNNAVCPTVRLKHAHSNDDNWRSERSRKRRQKKLMEM